MFIEQRRNRSYDEREQYGPCSKNSSTEILRCCVPSYYLMLFVISCPGDCGPPPDLLFASPVNKLHKMDFKTGTILKYTCHPGYSRIGSSRVTCNAKGSWDYSVFCISKYQHLFFSPAFLFY